MTLNTRNDLNDTERLITLLPERAWIGVASAEHAAYAASHGWIQLNHGKRNTLARLGRGDGFVYYSPTRRFGEKTPLRAITQLGIVTDFEPYMAAEPMDMGARGTFRPWRRKVTFICSTPMAVSCLPLKLTQRRSWGYSLRFGLMPLSPDDFQLLRYAMLNDIKE